MQPFLRIYQSSVQPYMQRYPRLVLLVVYALVFFPIYAGILVGSQVYVAGDTLGFNYPPLLALQPFSLGSLLADPLSGRGFPWIVTYGTFDPLAHFLRIFFSAYTTLGWLCYTYLVLGGWLFSLFLIRKNVSHVAAFIGGLVFVGAFFWTADGDYPLASSPMIFAALLLFATYLSSHPWRGLLGIMLATGFGWLAGHFNFVPLMIVATGVYVFMGTLSPNGRTVLARTRPLILYILGVGMGTAIGLIKLIPTFAYVGLSIRAGGLSVESASNTTFSPAAFFTALFPYANIPLVPGEVGLLFWGAAGLGLLIIGALQFQRKNWLALLGLTLCLITIVPHSPIYALIQSLPFFSFLRTPTRWLIVAHGCVGFIVARTIDFIHVGNTKAVRGVGIGLLLLGVGAAVFSACAAFVNVLWGDAIVATAQQYFDTHLYSRTSGLELAHYHRHIEHLWHLGLENISPFSLRFLFPLGGLLCTGWIFSKGVFRTQNRAAVLAVAACVSLLPSFLLYYPKVSVLEIEKARDVWDLAVIGDAPVLPLLSGLADLTERTGLVGDDPYERVQYQLGLLIPNMQALVGVHSIDFYQPIQPTRISRILAALGSQNAPAPDEERLAHSSLPLEEKIAIVLARLPLMQRIGVQYVSSAWELPAPFVYERSLSFVDHLAPIHLYRIPDPRPLLSVPSSVLVRELNENEAVGWLRDNPQKDPVLIECSRCAAGEFVQPEATISLAEQTDTSVSFTIEASSDVLVQALLPRLPGWRASIDGELVPTAIADGQFFAVPIPAGDHTVELRITNVSLLIDSAKRLLHRTDPWQL